MLTVIVFNKRTQIRYLRGQIKIEFQFCAFIVQIKAKTTHNVLIRQVIKWNRFFAFLQRVSIACYAKRCISYRKSVRLSVRLSVCQTLVLCQNDSSYDHGVFTVG